MLLCRYRKFSVGADGHSEAIGPEHLVGLGPDPMDRSLELQMLRP